jgi:TP901 family phage tail tape measure protein
MAGSYNLGTAEGIIRLKYDGAGADQAEQGFNKLGKSATTSAATFDRVGTRAGIAGTVIAAGVAFATNKAIDFEKQISAIGAVSGATGSDLEALRSKALQLGADTAFSASEAANAMEELAKAGIPLPDILNGAADAAVALAAAGGVSLADAATIAANAMNAFGISAKDMPKVVDLIAGAANASAIDVGQFGQSLQQAGAVANLAGVPFSDLAVAIAEMGNAGIKGSDAGTSIKTFLQNLIPTTKQQVALFDQLGITTNGVGNQFFDAAGKAKPLADISQVLQDKLKGMSEEQKIATLQTLFGSDAIRAAAILADNGAAGFNNLAGAMGKVSAESVANQRLNNTAGDLERLKGSVETAAISMGTLLLPRLRDMASALADFANWLNGLSPGWQSFIINSAGAAAGALLLLSAIAKVISSVVLISGAVTAMKAWTIWSSLATVGTNLWAAATWLLDAALAVLTAPITLVIIAVLALVAVFVILWMKSSAFRDFFINLWNSLKASAMQVAAFFSGPFVQFFVSAWNAIVNAFNGVINFIVTAWNAVISFFSSLPGRIMAFLTALPGMLLNLFLNALNMAAYAVGYGLGLIYLFFTQVLPKVGAFLAGLPALLMNLFLNAWNAAVNATANGIAAVYNFASQVGNRINAFLSSLPGMIGNLFTNAWNAAKNFTSAGISAVISFISQLPGRISAGISAIPGILGNLFSNAMNAARNAVSSGVSTVVGAFQAIPGAIRNLASSLYSAGADMIRGAINGVLSAVGGLVSAARDAAGRAVQGFKDALHIGSPSRLMAVEVGKPIVQGVIVGMDSMHDQLAQAAAYLSITGVASAAATVPASIAPSRTATAATTSPAININQTVNALPGQSAGDIANEANRKLAFGVRTGVNSIASASAGG